MGKFGLAWKAFWRTLRDPVVADQVESILVAQGQAALPPPPAPAVVAPPSPKAPVRSEALTLLSALQREARLVDFLKEPIAAYSDAQIGAAVRDVHRDCAAVLERLFALQPVVVSGEGDTVEVPAGFDNAKYRLVGNVSGEPPFRGELTHHGWQAQKCELPAWTGNREAALIVSPAEVELK